MEVNTAEAVFIKEETICEETAPPQPEYHENTNCEIKRKPNTETNGHLEARNDAIKEEWLEDVHIECKEETPTLDDANLAPTTWGNVVVKYELRDVEDVEKVESAEDAETANRDVITSDQGQYQKEIRQKSGTYACSECLFESSSRRQFQSHVQNHNGTGSYGCDNCSYRSSRPCSLKVHISRDHQNRSEYTCYTCGYRTYWKHLLKIHMRMHSGETPYCLRDLRGFDQKGSLKRHLCRSEGTQHKKFFYCDVCDFKTNQAGYLESHMRIHTNELYSCDACYYSCSKAESLKAHLKVHTQKKPFRCSYCDLKLRNLGELKRHVLVHSGQKRFACDACEFRTDRVSNLKTHVKRRHTGEKPFSCGDCDYKCTTASDLKRHEATHTGLKLFVCAYCGYKCSRHDVLVSHTRTHTGEKPYICDVCDYACTQLTNLKTHKCILGKKKNYLQSQEIRI